MANLASAQIDSAQWLHDQFPASLQQTHFLLAEYQWLCLVALIFVGILVGQLVRYLLRRATAVATKLTGNDDAPTSHKLWRPMGILASALVWYLGTEAIGLPESVTNFLLATLKVFAVVATAWTLFLIIDLLSVVLMRKSQKTHSKFDDLLVPLATKSLKFIIVCLGLLTGADALNLPLAGLIGGLGIGGLALAMASKDAVANLFGSLTVLIDRPFEVGDWIITPGAEGTVEDVGFRSTRIRTPGQSLITLPNSLLTTAVVDNLGQRQYRRIKATLGVEYGTTTDQLEAFCEGIRELIRRHPYTRKEQYHAYFNSFGDSSLDVLLVCYLECSEWAIELRERERLLLDIMRLAERLHIAFAFPTRTLHTIEQKPGKSSAELSDPQATGKELAAQLAGEAKRQGSVEF